MTLLPDDRSSVFALDMRAAYVEAEGKITVIGPDRR
jgi:hypothetical protein